MRIYMEYQPNVGALLELSGYRDSAFASEMMTIVKKSPDPETAARYVLRHMPVQNEILQNKWRKYIFQEWSKVHPKVPTSLSLPITSKEVASSQVLLEVYTLMQDLVDNPAVLNGEYEEHFLDAEEERRIAFEVPLFSHDPLHVRRICAILEELRLVRPYKGHVQPVVSRYRTFQALPLPSQYYLVWHVDIYHLDWKEYFHELSSHVAVFQQYIPMVWEMLATMNEGEQCSADEIAGRIVRAFRPMWQQESEKMSTPRLRPALNLYEQSVLQGMVSNWLIEGVCKRYGFITGQNSDMQWARIGRLMLNLERTTKLPCSTDVLS